jgi:asparagine synthase (glutamine-hydrolysing)
VSKFLLSRAVHDAGYKVVYTGEGSDEIFGGYVHFRIDMIQHNTHGQDPAEAGRLVQQLEAANRFSRGMLIPVGETGSLESVERLLGFVPGCRSCSRLVGSNGNPCLTPTSRHGLRDATASACFLTA